MNACMLSFHLMIALAPGMARDVNRIVSLGKKDGVVDESAGVKDWMWV